MNAYAAERARLLLGCFRKGDANDPTTYVAAIAATLSRYPTDVIKAVTHPASGLPTQKNFLPTVAEVYNACEEIMEPRRARAAAEQRRVERAQEAAELAAASDDNRPVDLKAKYGPNYGLDPSGGDAPRGQSKPAPSWEKIAAMYQADPSMIQQLMKRDPA